jgi:hypothetical protein
MTGCNATDESKALSEAKIAGALRLGQGQDLIAGSGLTAAIAQSKGTNGPAVFSAVSAERSRYNTGSHVDSYGRSFLVGLAQTRNDATIGGFIEGGRGNYNTYNALIKGTGKSDYIGIGGLIRRDAKNGLYREGSLRIGGAGTDFNGIAGANAGGYKTRTLYWGAHYGIGRITQRKDITIDLYGKLLYSRQQGDSLTPAGVNNPPVSFSAFNSLRLRAGASVKENKTRGLIFHGGLAYEQELMGKQKASALGVDIKAPSLKGGTVIGEMGVSLKKRPDSRFTLDAKAQGYLGKREGVGVSVNLNWLF